MPPTIVEQLPVPPFESEAKRITSAVAKAHKPQTVNIVESGTSVAPRQRPKGTSTANKPLGLGLPPSPSPRTNITSPQPQQPVLEQFQVNFPAITTTVKTMDLSNVAQTNTSTEILISTANINKNQTTEVLNSLFDETGFPDPFSESSTAKNVDPEECTTNIESKEPPTEIALDESLVIPGDCSDQMLPSPKSSQFPTACGHRRNVSDTSAFNK